MGRTSTTAGQQAVETPAEEPQAQVFDIGAMCDELNQSAGDLAQAIAPVSNSPYLFFDGKGAVVDPLASSKTPDWVREHAMPLPVDEKGDVKHPFNLAIAQRLLVNVESGNTVTTLAKLFPHGSVRRQDGSFKTANVSAQTVEHSFVVAIPGFDADKVLGGLETAKFVPMKEVAQPTGDGRYIVPSNAMSCRVKVNTNQAGEVIDFTLMAAAELAIRQSGGGQDDTVWDDASTSVKVKSLTNLAGQAKQLLAAMHRITWVCMYRQSLPAGTKAAGDVYQTVLVRLATNYYGMPFGCADRKGEVREDGETPVIPARMYSRLVGLDDPSGRAKDLPAEYVWKNFSGVFA